MMPALLHPLLYTGVALWLLTDIGNRLCRAIFSLSGLKDATAHLPAAGHSAGRWIGTLERLILAVGILAHSWEILAAVIALKTVARFNELNERVFAEYFLIGSLFSIAWTMAVTALWLGYDRTLGRALYPMIARLIVVAP
ncbi:hypothetical protein [Sphingomonas sp.]|uniref:hypothetical protein n=1 Tax=Sphingomonas sp. TaxID=28214 RepID=UPI0035B29987